MKIVEYGKENKNVIMLLHGGGLSWWNYREVAEKLQADYHIVIPILDGHAGGDNHFVSIEQNALEIIAYIDAEYGGSVLFLGGLSLGGQIAIEILSQRQDICQFALIESALIIPMKLTHGFVKPMIGMSYGLIEKEWFQRLQFQSLKIKKDLFEDYYRDSCCIKKEDMIAFLLANTSYSVKTSLRDTKAKVFIFVGEKEQRKMILSAKKLHSMLPGSALEIQKHMYHGDFSINHAERYADEIIRIIGDKESATRNENK